MRTTCIILISLLTLTACGKKDSDSFENKSKPDCNNLKVRKVTFHNFPAATSGSGKPFSIDVQIENTCKSCDDKLAFLGLFMIDKTTQEIVAQTPCAACFLSASNNASGIYTLETSLNALPDLNNIRFDYSYHCNDVPYDPK